MMARNLQFKVYLGLWGVMNTTISTKSAKGYSRLVSFPAKHWIYHQNNQLDISQIQVHFVPYPDPYPFHTRIMPCRTHPPSLPFVDIQVYSTYQIYPHPLYVAAVPLMKSWYRYVHMYVYYICMYLFLYLYLYLNNTKLYSYRCKPLWQGPDQTACWQLLVPYVRITAERSIPVFWAIPR